jgi:hypothetical protein
MSQVIELFVKICQLGHKLKLGTGMHPDTHTERTQRSHKPALFVPMEKE